MMKNLVPTLILLLLASSLFAQKKSELIDQINDLNSQLKTTQTALTESQKNLSTAQIKADNLDFQITQLKETNDGLLKNLNNFIEASTKKSDNIGRTLETLRQKEEQLKAINNVFSTNDSIALLVLTDLKKTLGENARIEIENGSVSVLMNNSFLFGAKAENSSIDNSAKDFLSKIASTVNKHAMVVVSIESMGGNNWGIIANRASAVAGIMQNAFHVAPDRLFSVGKVGKSEATYVRLHPKFDSFYLWLRDNMKNGNK